MMKLLLIVLFFSVVAFCELEKCAKDKVAKIENSEDSDDEVRTFRVKATSNTKPLKERANLATGCPNQDANENDDQCTDGGVFRTCTFAGQNTHSGSLEAWFDKADESVKIRFTPTEDKWNAGQLHVFVGSAEFWTQTFGGRTPQPGQFAHKEAGADGPIELTVTKEEIKAGGVDLDASDSCPESLRVAVHLEQGGETGWAFGDQFDTARWGWYFDIKTCCTQEEVESKRSLLQTSNLATECPADFETQLTADEVCPTPTDEVESKRAANDGTLRTCVYAGQHMFAGSVEASFRNDGVHVQFTGAEGFTAGKVHVGAYTEAAWAARDGNVAPGQFNHQNGVAEGSDGSTISAHVTKEELLAGGIDLDAADRGCVDGHIVLAVHMEVSGGGSESEAGGETAWAFGDPFPGSRWGWSVKLPCCPSSGDSYGNTDNGSANDGSQSAPAPAQAPAANDDEDAATDNEDADADAGAGKQNGRAWCVAELDNGDMELVCEGPGCADAEASAQEANMLLHEQGLVAVDIRNSLPVSVQEKTTSDTTTLTVLIVVGVVLALAAVALVVFCIARAGSSPVIAPVASGAGRTSRRGTMMMPPPAEQQQFRRNRRRSSRSSIRSSYNQRSQPQPHFSPV